MAEQQTILEATGLTKEFKGFVAVKNVSLRVRRHTIHALIGPNGAGKTTCFNLLTHFLEPTAGRISFNGRDITGSSPAAIARMGLARSFQISAVFPHLTVRENVRVALQRKLGNSFHFWRSERVLGELDERAPNWSRRSASRPMPGCRRSSCPTAASGRSRSPPRWRSIRR
jgi:branched-chain amino acid transport system ATP-binding protein